MAGYPTSDPNANRVVEFMVLTKDRGDCRIDCYLVPEQDPIAAEDGEFVAKFKTCDGDLTGGSRPPSDVYVMDTLEKHYAYTLIDTFGGTMRRVPPAQCIIVRQYFLWRVRA